MTGMVQATLVLAAAEVECGGSQSRRRRLPAFRQGAWPDRGEVLYIV